MTKAPTIHIAPSHCAVLVAILHGPRYPFEPMTYADRRALKALRARGFVSGCAEADMSPYRLTKIGEHAAKIAEALYAAAPSPTDEKP